MNYRASKVTTFAMDAARTVSSGETITVFGIIISNTTSNPADLVFQNGSGTAIITVTVPANDSKIIDIEFIADDGLVIASAGSADVDVTVFYSQGGS